MRNTFLGQLHSSWNGQGDRLWVYRLDCGQSQSGSRNNLGDRQPWGLVNSGHAWHHRAGGGTHIAGRVEYIALVTGGTIYVIGRSRGGIFYFYFYFSSNTSTAHLKPNTFILFSSVMRVLYVAC